jgi:hypothetical protein
MRRDRNRIRRQRALHNPRVPHLCDIVAIDARACQALLARQVGQMSHLEPLDEVERLLLEIVIRHGDGVIKFSELRRIAQGAVLQAGSVKAAIEAMRRG